MRWLTWLLILSLSGCVEAPIIIADPQELVETTLEPDKVKVSTLTFQETIQSPQWLGVDSKNNLYIVQLGHGEVLYAVEQTTGKVTKLKLAGGKIEPYYGQQNLPPGSTITMDVKPKLHLIPATSGEPMITLDSQDNIYVSSLGGGIQKVIPTPISDPFDAFNSFYMTVIHASLDGRVSGLYFPKGIIIGENQEIYVLSRNLISTQESWDIQKVKHKTLTRIDVASQQESQFGLDFNRPVGIAIDKNNTFYVTDSGAHLVYKVNPKGQLSTYAGNNPSLPPYRNVRPSTVIPFPAPTLPPFPKSNSYSQFSARTFPGSYVDGKASESWFNFPSGIVVDKQGNLFIADTENHAIRKITTDGMVIKPSFLDLLV